MRNIDYKSAEFKIVNDQFAERYPSASLVHGRLQTKIRK